MTPRAAYVHVPFCAHRCGYCNFTVIAGRDELVAEYLRAVRLELSWLQTPRAVDTLYLGGGTPTRMPPQQLYALGDLLANWFPLEPGYEFTIEANPNDLSEEMVGILADMGANRISLGVQSFDVDKLRVLERSHRPADVARAVDRLCRSFGNISIDLMFGVPGETLETWRRDLHLALKLPITHVSTYGLTYERGAAFWSRRARRQLVPVGEESERTMYLTALDVLAEAGMEHYEISSFARPGWRCRHNEVYWSGQPYYAVGPGASKYVEGCRQTNHRSTTTYLRRVLAGASPVAESERLSPEERARERLVLGLRMRDGVALEQFARETGYEVATLADKPLEKFLALGLLRLTNGVLQLTREGLLVSDSMWPELLDTEA